MPALLVERAVALARAEAELALTHARHIAVRAVSALLGTIVACAFSQLVLLLLVAWPVLSPRVPPFNLLLCVLASVLLAAAGVVFAIVAWTGVGRERRRREAEGPSAALGAAGPLAGGFAMKGPGTIETADAACDERPAGNLAKEGSL